MKFPEGTKQPGENQPEDRLDDEELVLQVTGLMEEFKQALLNNPAFNQAAAKKLLYQTTETSIPFVKDGIPYLASHRRFAVTNDEILYITRHPQGALGTKREHVEIKRGGMAGDGLERWGYVQWGSMFEPGKEPEYHTNTQTALEKIGAFLHDLQGTV